MPAIRSRLPLAALILALAALLSRGGAAVGQNAEPEEGRFRTPDGLRLYYQWFAGGKGQKSDSVILVPNYNSDITKGPWVSLAKGLQKEGYSVLLFDFRGHGKNADNRAMSKPDEFIKHTYNRYAGVGLSPNIKEIKKEKFSPNYYPYLVNDLSGARRFLDEQNDAGQCNSGRVFVITEQSSCPLVMLWATTEFGRYAFGPKTKMDEPENVSAGEDLCGVVFLSWQGSAGQGTGTAVSIATRVMQDRELSLETNGRIGDQLRKKVAMAFIYGKEDAASRNEARSWFSRFGIPANKSSDAEIVKYIREVPGAEKLAGINLFNITEKQKDSDEKVSYLENQILEFMRATKTKSINGNNWKERKMENLDPVPVPLDKWGLKAPK